MAFRFLRNPISGVLGVIRGITDIAGRLREPLGSAVGKVGRALANLGAEVEAAAIRSRMEREAKTARDAKTALGKSSTVVQDESQIPEATTKLRRRFSYTVRVTHIDPATGQRITRHLTVSTDSLMTEEQVEDQARAMIGGPYGVKTDFITEVEVTGVKKAGAAGTL